MGGRFSARATLKALPILASVGLLVAAAPADPKVDNPIADICHAEQKLPAQSGARFDILPGMGDGGFKIRSNAQAQAWFDYGLKMFHAFYHDDAKTAFDKAVSADPDCAMCLWGQALSRGSNQNYDAKPDSIADGLAMARKAKEKAQGPLETALANAMIARLEAKPDAAAETLYAQAVLMAARGAPDNLDLPLLASEADLTAWRRGDRAGGAKAEAIVAPILKQHPDNSAAIHYYIHATEMAGHPQLALPYAKKLAARAPGASHLVHMAAHTFFWAGLYEDAAVVNARALAVDADHFRALGDNRMVGQAFYYTHNHGFGEAGALISGDKTLAVKFADDFRKVFPESSFDKGGLAGSEGRGYVIYGRYAPERMLAMPEPAADRDAARVLFHYGRGEALAGKGDGPGVRHEADAITQTTPQAQVAKAVLTGRAAMLDKDYAGAARAFEQASEVQGQMFATQMDPPPWWYLVRRSVAAAKFAAGDYKGARDEAEAGLTVWKDDPLMMLVLSRAQSKLGDKTGAAHSLAVARASWRGGKLESYPLNLI